MPNILLLNKPFGVISQFSGGNKAETLSAFIQEKGFYPAGRLDKDSEGLLVLTDNGKLQSQISDPRFKIGKKYIVQIEKIVNERALETLRTGVELNDGITKPSLVRRISEPSALWARTPPIRVRNSIPTSWIEITIYEGGNRQIRRMTAAVGFPTLRLVRITVGNWQLGDLLPGQFSKQIVKALN